jgi:hypothetical protein
MIDGCARGSHVFKYGGVRYIRKVVQKIGEVEVRLDYYDFFWCERCLEMKMFLLSESDFMTNDPRFGAIPVHLSFVESERPG